MPESETERGPGPVGDAAALREICERELAAARTLKSAQEQSVGGAAYRPWLDAYQERVKATHPAKLLPLLASLCDENDRLAAEKERYRWALKSIAARRPPDPDITVESVAEFARAALEAPHAD